MLPVALERVARGDSGDPQDESQASYLGAFEPEYARIDLTRSCEEVARQVRAWRFHSGVPHGKGALTEIDGEDVRVLRVSSEPGDGDALACADGTLWIVETETP
jgi:methionyl-tRNA formyltransferase